MTSGNSHITIEGESTRSRYKSSKKTPVGRIWECKKGNDSKPIDAGMHAHQGPEVEHWGNPGKKTNQ